MQTRDQKYAVDVYEKVSQIRKEGKTVYKGYGAMAHKLPVLIRTGGLMQALAYVDARGKDPQKKLLQDLAETVGKPDAAALLKRARESEMSEYMLLTHQVIDALLWYKRFAQSVLDVDAGEDEG